MDPAGSGLPESARKELFSYAYVTAIAAAAQCEVLAPKMDFDSVDAQIFSMSGRRPQINVQLKATAQDCVAGDTVVFDLPVKNYNDLRSVERCVPAMLVVLHLPKEELDWISHTIDLLSLRNSAYYYNLSGLPPIENTTTVRLRIPSAQRLTKESLQTLLDHVSKHKRLP
jgi:hypothetical protein